MEKNKLIKDIKEEAKYWFSMDLTNEQIKEYLDKNTDVDCFDTVEREDFASYISLKITGMEWPMYGDSQEYKDKFYKLMDENAEKMGYKFI